MKPFIFAWFFVFLSACSSSGQLQVAPAASDVMAIIEASEAASPKGFYGRFNFYIKASGKDYDDRVYLNTQDNYRDRRNITIDLTPGVVYELTKLYGANPADYFIGKRIQVVGKAKRETIWFYANRRRSSSYYYQTHILVKSIKQITLLD